MLTAGTAGIVSQILFERDYIQACVTIYIEIVQKYKDFGLSKLCAVPLQAKQRGHY